MGGVGRGQALRRRVGSRRPGPHSTSSAAPTSSSTPLASPAHPSIDPAVAPDAVWVSVTPFGAIRPARRLASVRPRRDGRERKHVLHRRPGPRAGAVHRALRATRTSARRPRSPRSPGSRAGGRSGSTSRCRKSSSSRTWRHRPASRRPGSAACDAAPTSGAPARSGRRATASSASGCGVARRGFRAWRRSPGSSTLRPCSAMDWSTFSPNTADDETLRAIEVDVAAYFAGCTDAGALRHRVRDEPDARADQLAPRDPRPAPSSRHATSSDRSASTTKVPAAFVTVESADGRAAKSRPAAPAPGIGDAALRDRRDGAPARDRRIRRRLGRDEHPRVRLRRGGPDRDPLLRRARCDRPAGRVQGPAGLPPRLRARARRTRTASRVRRCSTG